MSQAEDWEKEKIRRLQGDTAGPSPQDNPRSNNPTMNGSGPREVFSGPSERQRPMENITTAHTVKISSIMAFFIAGVFIMPVLFGGARLLFQREPAYWIALILAYGTTFPIGKVLERRSWPGTARLNIVAAILTLVGGGSLLVGLLIFIWGWGKVLQNQTTHAEAVEKRNIVSEKQLPLAGYEHESRTKEYLTKVHESRSALGASQAGDLDGEYGNYKRIYVEPLQEMGYEFDITLRMAARRFVVKENHRRSSEDVEFLVFNAVCFRNRLFEEELITPETQNTLCEAARSWVRNPVPASAGAFAPTLALFDARCPVTDVSIMYKQ
jgi:hypothetical protein